MKLIIGSYILDNVTNTAYEDFITYYNSTPAAYITSEDIDRWNTRDDVSQMVSYSYFTEKLHETELVTATALNELSYSVNEIESDLTNLAPYTYVTEKISEILIPDVSNFVTFSYLQNKNYLTEHQSLSGYATESYVVSKVNEIIIPDTSEFVSYSYLNDKLVNIDNAIFMETNNLNQNISDLSYNILSYIEDNELVTAAAITDLSYRVNNLSYSIVIPEIDTSDFVSYSYLESKKYATESYVMGKVDEIIIPDVSGFVSYTYLEEKNYLTAHQDLSSYATISYVSSNIDNLSYQIERNEKVIAIAISSLAYDLDKIDIPDLTDYVSYAYIEERLNGIGGNVDLSSYATKTEISELSYNILSYIEDNELVTAAALTNLSYQVSYISVPDTSNFVSYSYLGEKLSEIIIPDVSEFVSYAYFAYHFGTLENILAGI